MSTCRMLFVITNLNVGGAEGMLYKLLSKLDRARFEPEVVTLIGPGPIGQQIEALGIRVRVLGMRRGVPDPSAVVQLASWIRKDRPDLIQTWMYHADLVGGLASKLSSGCPVAWGIRQSDLAPNGSKYLTRMTAKMCARLSHWVPTRIVCCSEAAREVHMALGYAADKMLVIPNGMDLSMFRPNPEAASAVRAELHIPADAPIVGLAARFHAQKDHRGFVRAAGRLHADHPDVHFVLCGNEVTWTNAQLVRWIDEAGIRHVSRLLGRRDDVPRLTAAFTLSTTASSFGEGFPNVVGEAMACGVPCVVTDVGDSARIVGETGRVVPPNNPAALAAAWRDIIDLDQEAKQRLGRAARQRIRDHFDLPSIVTRYENLYAEMAGVQTVAWNADHASGVAL